MQVAGFLGAGNTGVSPVPGSIGAAVREQTANGDRLKGVVPRVGAVTVAGFRGKAEGGLAGRSAVVRDDPHARAVFDLEGGVGGGLGACAPENRSRYL